MAEFVLMIGGELKTFSKYEDIPDSFDHLIKFKPDFPEGPHSEEEHELIHSWNEKLKKLIEKENASSNKNR